MIFPATLPAPEPVVEALPAVTFHDYMSGVLEVEAPVQPQVTQEPHPNVAAFFLYIIVGLVAVFFLKVLVISPIAKSIFIALR